MKKFIALAIAIVMMAALAVPAFAAGTGDVVVDGADTGCKTSTDLNAPSDNDNMIVRYDLAEQYELTIPAVIALSYDADARTAAVVTNTISIAEDCYLGTGRTLTVKAASENNWEVVDCVYSDTTTIPYTMYIGSDESGTEVANDTVVYTVNAGTLDPDAVTLAYVMDDVDSGEIVTYAGCYKDTVTFTAAIN